MFAEYVLNKLLSVVQAYSLLQLRCKRCVICSKNPGHIICKPLTTAVWRLWFELKTAVLRELAIKQEFVLYKLIARAAYVLAPERWIHQTLANTKFAR